MMTTTTYEQSVRQLIAFMYEQDGDYELLVKHSVLDSEDDIWRALEGLTVTELDGFSDSGMDAMAYGDVIEEEPIRALVLKLTGIAPIEDDDNIIELSLLEPLRMSHPEVFDPFHDYR